MTITIKNTSTNESATVTGTFNNLGELRNGLSEAGYNEGIMPYGAKYVVRHNRNVLDEGSAIPQDTDQVTISVFPSKLESGV